MDVDGSTKTVPSATIVPAAPGESKPSACTPNVQQFMENGWLEGRGKEMASEPVGVTAGRNNGLQTGGHSKRDVIARFDSESDYWSSSQGRCIGSPSNASERSGCQGILEGKRSAWGSLRPPSASDLTSRSRRRPGEPFTHLVVLDFEWTADDRRPVRPISEITQFPSVLVSLSGRSSSIISEFDTYVRPTLNPVLSDFATELTGITQRDVDDAPTLTTVLPRYMAWLQGHGLVNGAGSPLGRWAVCTWSDADIGGQLGSELRHKRVPMPPCFRSWVNLKVLYQCHYRAEPRGGLRRCVERLGLTFEGRAHNGLVDSRNTAKIVLHMARGSDLYPAFVFRGTTRGLDRYGRAFGSRSDRDNLVAKVTGKRAHALEGSAAKRRPQNPHA